MRSPPAIELTPGRFVGAGQVCFIVAEIGQNHNGRMSFARRLIDGVAECGADAVKFCKRHLPSELTRAAAARPYVGPQSFGATYGAHRQALELSAAQHAELKVYADNVALSLRERKGERSSNGQHFGPPVSRDGVTGPHSLAYFATACDAPSVDELEAIGVPCYKVASRDLANLPLIEHIARTGKPVILSCGMDGLDEISQALDTVRMHHEQVILLQCTSAYPTPDADVNLRALETLRREFDVAVGFSDHSVGSVVSLAAVALGAVLIEKHVTLHRRLRGTDHACSLELPELHDLVSNIRRIEAALGDGVKRVPESVTAARLKLSRAVVSRCEIPRGTRVTEDMLCLKCAGAGLTWFDRKRLIGRVARRDIEIDEALSAADVE